MHNCHFKLKFYRCEFNNILSNSSSTSSNIPCCKTTCIMLAHNNLKNTFGHCMCMCLTQRMFRIRANRSVPLIQKSFRFSANTSVLLAFACFFLCFGLCGLAVQGVVVVVDILLLSLFYLYLAAARSGSFFFFSRRTVWLFFSKPPNGLALCF